MIDHLYIVSAASLDPRVNLAAESVLLDQLKENALILYLWQNANTVVIGRNQNYYRECNIKNIERDQVTVVRRQSGGGAVYHDTGNLNFTFFAYDEDYDVQRQSSVILAALKEAGIEGSLSGRNDMLVQGHKFSGSAYYHHKGRSYHHGTLLVDSDLSKMPLYLNPDPLKLKANSVSSVRSRVINLCELCPSLNVESLKTMLVKACEAEYGLTAEYLAMPSSEEIEPYYQKYSSDAWILGKNPPFDIELEHRFSWGSLRLGLNVKNGMIRDVSVYSDSMEPDLIDAVPVCLKNIPFTSSEMSRALDQMNTAIGDDIGRWLKEQEF